MSGAFYYFLLILTVLTCLSGWEVFIFWIVVWSLCGILSLSKKYPGGVSFDSNAKRPLTERERENIRVLYGGLLKEMRDRELYNGYYNWDHQYCIETIQDAKDQIKKFNQYIVDYPDKAEFWTRLRDQEIERLKTQENLAIKICGSTNPYRMPQEEIDKKRQEAIKKLEEIGELWRYKEYL